MPYHIEPYKDGYRVISVSGRPLSKKPLSLKKAEEQKTAVNISEHIEEKINPKFTLLPEKDSTNIKNKIMKNVKSELLLRLAFQ